MWHDLWFSWPNAMRCADHRASLTGRRHKVKRDRNLGLWEVTEVDVA